MAKKDESHICRETRSHVAPSLEDEEAWQGYCVRCGANLWLVGVEGAR